MCVEGGGGWGRGVCSIFCRWAYTVDGDVHGTYCRQSAEQKQKQKTKNLEMTMMMMIMMMMIS